MLTFEHLDAGHDVSSLDSGEATLDDWLQTQGLASQKKGTSRVFVLVETTDPGRRVLAYYSLSAHVIEREQLTRRLGRGMPGQLPSVLLGKLALDVSRHNGGLGGQVLAEAVARVTRLCDEVGFRFLVVDALHERAAAFYEHFGFSRIPTGDSLRLVLRVMPALLGP